MARLIPNLEKYYRPKSIEDAYKLIQSNKSARIVAGGTGFAFNQPDILAVIDISQLPLHGLRLTQNNDLEIGSVATIKDIETASEIAGYANGVLIETCDKLASTPLRNLITIGGNILGGFPWSDLPVTLLTLDAKIRYFDETFEMKDIESGYQRSDLLPSGALLTHIILPAEKRNAVSAFSKFTQTDVDFALVSVAVSFILENNYLKNVRIACGSIESRPKRLFKVEQALEGMEPSEENLAMAGKIASQTVNPRETTQWSVEYRISVLSTLIERTIRKALKRAEQ